MFKRGSFAPDDTPLATPLIVNANSGKSMHTFLRRFPSEHWILLSTITYEIMVSF